MPTPQIPHDYLAAVSALKESLMRLVRELDPESLPIEEVIEMLIEIAEFEHAIASAMPPREDMPVIEEGRTSRVRGRVSSR